MPIVKPLTLRRNFSWTFAGNMVYVSCQWGMLAVIAKLGSPEMVGQFTLGLAVTAPIIMFSNLQLRSIQATDTKHEYLFGDYLGLRLIATGLATLMIFGIAWKSGYRWDTTLVVVGLGLAKAVDSISDVFNGLIQQHERMDRIAISSIIKGILSLLFVASGVYLTHSVFWGTLGLIVANLIVLVGYDIPSGALIFGGSFNNILREFKLENWDLLRPDWHWGKLKQLFWLSLPLGFTMMLISLNTNIPRYFIERHLGERELGLFAAISYSMVAANMVVGALGQSASPRLAKYYAAGNSHAFRALLLKLIGIGLLVGIVGIFVVKIGGKEILTILYRPEYAQTQYLDILLLLMVSTTVSNVSSFLGYGMTAIRYFSVQLPLSILVTGISALSCYWLIPRMGLRGAAMALLIGAVVQTIFSLGVVLHGIHKLDRSIRANPIE
jgi:O-antigen/teichoic acid export membrane protein